MSSGIGAICKMIKENEEMAAYEYAVYSLDNAADSKKLEGRIEIDKAKLIEPTLEEREKTVAGKSQKVVYRIHNNENLEGLIRQHSVRIENYSQYTEEVGSAAYKLCRKLFEAYQDDGYLPESVEIHY